MESFIAVTKEPRWMKYLGILFLLPGVVAAVPFKSETIQALDIPFLGITVLGILLLARGYQRIGWRLNLEGNVLYYNKFHLYSSWKKRRSQEFALPLTKINKIEERSNELIINYDPGRQLKFNTRGLDSLSERRLAKLQETITTKIAD